jgi:hypothetical protein
MDMSPKKFLQTTTLSTPSKAEAIPRKPAPAQRGKA